MKLIFLTLTFAIFLGCMKSKDEYKNAIMDVRQEQVEKEKENSMNRQRGGNDVEGMGMDEA